MSEDYSEIDRFQSRCVPRQTTRLPGVDALPDGTANFEIVEGSLVRTPKQQETIFRFTIRVLSGQAAGLLFEWPHFFRGESSHIWLACELLVLGLPADRWIEARSFSRELKAACPQLAGMHFFGKKSTEGGSNGKRYARLHVNGRRHVASMPPSVPASAPPPHWNA